MKSKGSKALNRPQQLESLFLPLTAPVWLTFAVLIATAQFLRNVSVLNKSLLAILADLLPAAAIQIYSAGLASSLIAPTKPPMFQSVQELSEMIRAGKARLVLETDEFMWTWLRSSPRPEAVLLREASQRNPPIGLPMAEICAKLLGSSSYVALVDDSLFRTECDGRIQLRKAE